MYHQYCIPILM